MITAKPTSGRTCKAWRLKKKHKKAIDQLLTAMNEVIRTEFPVFMKKMAKAQVGPFRPSIFDLIRNPK